jgi:hypothetical protein
VEGKGGGFCRLGRTSGVFDFAGVTDPFAVPEAAGGNGGGATVGLSDREVEDGDGFGPDGETVTEADSTEAGGGETVESPGRTLSIVGGNWVTDASDSSLETSAGGGWAIESAPGTIGTTKLGSGFPVIPGTGIESPTDSSCWGISIVPFKAEIAAATVGKILNSKLK